MGRAERVVHVEIHALGQPRGRRVLVLRLAGVEARVLQHAHALVRHERVESLRDGRDRECRIGALRPAEMRADRDLSGAAVERWAGRVLPQAALAEYLKHGGYERHLRGFRQRLRGALAAMSEAVATHFPAGCRLTQPQGGYMLWVEMPESIDALRLHQLALAEGISIAPGPLFSVKRKYGNFVRLNYGHFNIKSTVNAVRTVGHLAGDLLR